MKFVKESNISCKVLETHREWIVGKVGDYKFEAKLMGNGYTDGLGGSSISKINIWNEQEMQHSNDFLDSCIYSYDGGLCAEPKEGYKIYLDAVINKVKCNELEHER